MTAVLDRPARPARPAAGASSFTGTLGLLRLYLRTDRIVLPLWVLLLSLPLSTVYIGSIEAVYPTAAARAGFAASIMASPAQRAIYGNIYNDSLGAAGIWKAGMFHVLIAVAVILTMIRHTRADEEAGRTELIDSTAVGRNASLTAALLLTGGGSVLTGLLGFLGLLNTDVPVTGSLAFSCALAASGLVFTAVAAVAAQLSASARVARGTAFGVLGAAFTLRAVGDASGSELSWASPLGWSLLVRPYAGDRFGVLALHVTLTVALVVLAYQLQGGRDVGAGMFAERRGRPRANGMLNGPTGLAWRLTRGSVLVWTVGLGLYGLLVGSVVHGIGDELGGSGSARDIITRLGGTSALEEAFIAIAFNMLGMVAAAFAVSLALRPHQEETGQRAETLLAGALSRIHWLTGYLTIALAGTTVAMLTSGLLAGVTYGAAADDITGKLPLVLGSAAVQLPAIWLLIAVTTVLFGVMPRFTPVAWGALVGFIAVFLLGSLANSPHWVLDLDPFSHIPRVGSDSFTATPLMWLLVLDAILITLGALAFRRRDLR
ncbi:ABC transporter permease [Mycolicibacterium sp. 141076]|uniref:ABC transporter permease n=1 Tax=Mycolicibacterium sp. 141076 TaxID=3090599 RepID=UPI0009288F39|nr:ABC transporter permease [Mycolicibacterium sp. 141076]MDX1879875.1 ABC transporter permease [Mycolicibacterium sp. 141076]SHU75597.1 putative exporter of polyketide antibiotics [Mycobacteroides abscessus subsp. abscessus]